ncbi:MAG: V-type ATP synthase subunit F [Clostridiales bacterium]|nr:V-type ATP synthase subunit F [Clostridiales bacterium]
MKMYLVSDNIDTLVGMRLAGIDGVVVHDAAALEKEVGECLEDSDLGILMLTEKAAGFSPEYIRGLKLKLHTPIIVEIPDRHGSRDIAGSINNMVHESIGLKL